MGRPASNIVINESYQDLSNRFYQYQKRLGYVAESCRSRQLNVDEFFSWLEGKGILSINEVQRVDIQLYYEYISDRPNKSGPGILSQKTTHGHMLSIGYLFTMLQEEGSVKVHPVSGLAFVYPSQKEERIVLTQLEIEQLYEVCESAWECSILSLAYGCGLRVGELEKMNVVDVKLRDRILIVPNGKGNKRRVVPMSIGVVRDLSEYYFNERDVLKKSESQKAFMLNNRGGRMREFTYNKYLKRIIERTDNRVLINKQASIHSLRHSIATHLIEQGMKVEQVRQFLGHSQLETTQIYTHISQAQLSKLMEDDVGQLPPETL